MAGVMSAKSCVDMFANPTRKASCKRAKEIDAYGRNKSY